MAYYLSRRFNHAVVGPVRALARFHLFAATFVSLAALSVAIRALSPVNRDPVRARSARRWVGRRLTAAMGLRVDRRGARPFAAACIVGNHLSWIDSFLLLGELGTRFVADASWSGVPALATALRANGAFFITRSRLADTRRVGGTISRLLKRGEPILVFPEADTSRGGAVLPFRPALLEPAARLGVPVSWLTIRYDTPAGWPPASVVAAWADWTPLLVHIYRAFHPPRITVTVTYGGSVRADDRKVLARRLHACVTEAFIPHEQLDAGSLARVTTPPSRPVPKF